MSKFLDTTGVDVLWSKIKTLLSGKADKATTIAGYGITDAKIENGTIKLNGTQLTPLTQHQDISGKVDKVTGKGLSTEDFTTVLKTKLESLSNFDASEINTALQTLNTKIDTLVGTSDLTTTIDTFNEVVDFLANINKDNTLNGILNGIRTLIDTKLDISTYNSEKKTKLSQFTDNLGSNPTHTHSQYATSSDLTSKQDSLVSGTNIKTINNQSILGSGNISIQAGSNTNVVQETGSSTTSVMSQNAVTTALSGKANTATTLAGYGITDAKIENGTIYLGNQTLTPSEDAGAKEVHIGATAPTGDEEIWFDTSAGDVLEVVQSTGQSTTNVMSQKAVTDALAGVGGSSSVISGGQKSMEFIKSVTIPEGQRMTTLLNNFNDYSKIIIIGDHSTAPSTSVSGYINLASGEVYNSPGRNLVNISNAKGFYCYEIENFDVIVTAKKTQRTQRDNWCFGQLIYSAYFECTTDNLDYLVVSCNNSTGFGMELTYNIYGIEK